MDLLRENVGRLYGRYLAAAFGSALISSIYAMVDMAMVGQYQGPEGTAALAVVDPHRSDCPYPFKCLAGVGVALKLVLALGGRARQEELLERKMADLLRTREESRDRRARLLRYRDVEAGAVTCRTMPERPCVLLQEDVILEKEIDFLLKKLEKRHSNTIKIMGKQTMGALLDRKSMRPGDYKHFSFVFFLTGPDQERDTVLPAGEYASLFYRGSYEHLEEHCQTLFRGVAALGLELDGAPLELYRIDAHDTDLEEEYLTELQVKVKRAGKQA